MKQRLLWLDSVTKQEYFPASYGFFLTIFSTEVVLFLERSHFCLRLMGAVVLLCSGRGNAADSAERANDLVNFLAGKWDNVSFEISDGKDIKREAYPETMVIKDRDTLTITAHGFRDGKDLTKDMHLIVKGNAVTMQQGEFVAKGNREDSLYTLRGVFKGHEYRFRLYTLGDKYVFHRETWKNGKIEQIDMSYLIRKI